MRITQHNPSKEKKPRKGITKLHLKGVVVPLLAIVTALIIGGLIIVFTDESVYKAFNSGFFPGIKQAFIVITKAYGAFYTGAFGDPVRIVRALGSGRGIRHQPRPISYYRNAAYLNPLHFRRFSGGVWFPGRVVQYRCGRSVLYCRSVHRLCWLRRNRFAVVYPSPAGPHCGDG